MIEKVYKMIHTEGHTSLSYDDEGLHIATCGSDGSLRIWEIATADTMTTLPIGVKAFAVHIRKDHLYASNDKNGIPAMSFPYTEPEGFLSFFSAPVTHIVSNQSGSIVCAGSCDFTIRVINVKDRKYNVLKHEAPILGLALDPSEEFLVSSSCDGNVCAWNLSTNAKTKTWEKVLSKSNAFENSEVLCRASWEPVTGKYLAIPNDKSISVYERNNWELTFTLEDNRITSKISIAAFSPCGKYIAGGCVSGTVVIWNVADRKCIEINEQEKKAAITSLEWNPKKNGELSCCNSEGYLKIIEDVVPNNDNLLTEDEMLATFADDFDDDSENENSFSISKIKAETVGINDDSNDSLQIGAKRETVLNTIKDDDSLDVDIPKKKEEYIDEYSNHAFSSIPHTTIQEAFQPGSTPDHLDHHFMLWNSVGVIICHRTDEENSIDIDFHDTSVHHAVHITNNMDYNMAALSTEAAIFACRAEEENKSTLFCMHFGSWDTWKEWSIGMSDKEEEIDAIALGENWIAIATNLHHLRLFTISGVQLQVIRIPGPVVCMAGKEDKLLVAYHQGAGLPGHQNISIMVVRTITSNLFCTSLSLPLGPKNTLSWLGYTDEGTPTFVDSKGFLNILTNSSNAAWSLMCNTKAQVSGKSDNFFVVGLSETQQLVRGIVCKGSKFPATLPLPVVTVTPFKIPLCELSTEKAQFEEKIIRHQYLSSALENLEKHNYEVDHDTKESVSKILQETQLKSFALACKSDREFRATEICEQMNSPYTIQLATRYAVLQKHVQLAQRLNELVSKKTEEETDKNRQEIEHNKYYEPQRRLVETTVTNNVDRDEIDETDSVRAASEDRNAGSMDIISENESQDVGMDSDDDYTQGSTEIAITPTPSASKKNPFKKATNRRESTEIGKGIEAVDKIIPASKEKNTSSFAKRQKKLTAQSKPKKTTERKEETVQKLNFAKSQVSRPSESETQNSDLPNRVNKSASKKRKITSNEDDNSAKPNVAKKKSSNTSAKLSNFLFTKKT